MRLYQPPPPIHVIRVKIDKQLETSEYLTLEECTVEEVITAFKEMVESQNISPFTNGFKTSVTVRTYKDGKNQSDTKSISFKGLSPSKTKELFIEYLTSKGKELNSKSPFVHLTLKA